MPRLLSFLLRATILAGFLVAFLPATASGFGLSLSPRRVLLDIPAGDSTSYTLRVSLEGEQPVVLRAYAWDYWHGSTGRFTAPPGTTERSAAGWVEVVPREAPATPEHPLEFLVTVSVPSDAVGGYYGMLYVQTDLGSEDASGNESRTGVSVGAVLAVRVTGTGSEALEISGSQFVPPTASRPAAVTIDGKNTGDVHIPVEFRGVVRTTDGEVLGKVTTGHPRWFFPGESFSLEARWSTPMEPGAYELAGSVLYGEDLAIPLIRPLIVADEAPPESPPEP
jgi:hypothetical protein